ncbi:Calx-beta domain-containing protein [Durusdinium trenchii]|uniref:Calx-beta domain-containing protein n=1 Tax=Durusdinium trenchii TaxID=1381693 RepID=A0ABP0IEX5_9DINO
MFEHDLTAVVPGWRSDVELLLRKNSLDSPYSSPKRRPSGLQHAFWEGLYEKSERSKTFWQQAERLAASPPLQEEKPQNLVSFVHHTFPCFQRSRQAVLVLQRSGHAAHELDVAVEESFGGATDGKDFTAEIHIARFLKEQKEVTLPIPVVYHKGCWQNSYWFQARILNIHGEGQLAAPAQADILVLDEDTWPNNIPSSLRGGKGLSLLKYFIQADRHRRGRKWWKTMIAMVFLPVHSGTRQQVLVSTLVQKILVDHVIGRIIGSDPAWGYAQCLILVLVQLLSLGLNRWADVVQTRNRGRTGGIRQVHRSEMIRKFMHLERSEYWEASEADWLYSAIYDVDVITNKAYFGVFVMVQSCFALLLSVFLVIGLAAWSYLEQDASVGIQTAWYVLGVLVMMVAGVVGVWYRMKIIWVAVLARKKAECAWFKSCIFVFTSWRHFIGLLQTEKAQLEQGLLAQNEAFVPLHWDARDTMNDTAWITHWIQGVSYCLMLTIGSFGLADSQIYGVGSFEVGTFYALCKIYLSVGKYISRLSQVFVDMQRAVVSLRDVAAMLNQRLTLQDPAPARKGWAEGVTGQIGQSVWSLRTTSIKSIEIG